MDATHRESMFSTPVPPTQINPGLVLHVVNQHSALTDPHTPTIDISEAVDGDHLITVTEHERQIHTTLSSLVARFERARVEPHPADLHLAFTEWLDTRPVTDETAATRGIATIGWSNRKEQINWRVVVPRTTGTTLDWVPTVHTDHQTIHRIRKAAMARSQQLTVTPLPSGEVTVWVYLINPALSTSVLSQPALLAQNETLENLYAVFTPGRPVAVASKNAAARLTEESNEPHVTLALANLNNIEWM